MNALELWRNRRMSPVARDFFKTMENMWSSDEFTDELSEMHLDSEFSETPTHFNFKIDMPGLTKSDIKIELYDNRLIISGERRQQKKEESKDSKTYFSEVTYGNYFRSFDLPSPVRAEKIEATYENGVLSVAVPKADTGNAKLIAVK